MKEEPTVSDSVVRRRRSQRLRSIAESHQRSKSEIASTSSSLRKTITTTRRQQQTQTSQPIQKDVKKTRKIKRDYPMWVKQTIPSYLVGYYCPQLGDKVVFFRRGYISYLEKFSEFNASLPPPQIPEVVYCTIIGMYSFSLLFPSKQGQEFYFRSHTTIKLRKRKWKCITEENAKFRN